MAGLPKQTLSLPFLSGADSKTDPKQIDAPALAVCENLEFDSVKQLSQKQGHTAQAKNLVSGAAISETLTGIASRDGQALLLSPNRVYSQSGSGTYAQETSPNFRTSVKKRVIAGFSASSGRIGYATDGTWEYFAYPSSSGFVSVEKRSIATGAIAASLRNTVFADNVQIVLTSTHLLAFSSTSVFVIDLSTFTGSSVTLASGTTVGHDAALWRNTVVFASATTSAITLRFATAPFSSWSTASYVFPAPTATAFQGIAVGAYQASVAADDTLFIVTPEAPTPGDVSQAYIRVLNAALSASVGTGAMAASGTEIRARQCTLGGSEIMAIQSVSNVRAFSRLGAEVPIPSKSVSSDPFTNSGGTPQMTPISIPSWFDDVLVFTANSHAKSFMLQRCGSEWPAVCIGSGDLRAAPWAYVISGVVYWAASEKLRVQSTTLGEYQLVVYEGRLDTTEIGPPVEVNRVAMVPGGTLAAIDGAEQVPAGFLQTPQISSPTIASIGGTGVGPGTYQYLLVWEYFDARGNLYRSVPSAPITVTTTDPNSQVSFSYTNPPMNRLIGGNGRFQDVLYRTTNGGAIFYRNPTAQFDTTPDASLTTNEILYTTGGYLESAPPPPCTFVLSHQGRVFVIDAEDTDRVGYSKKLQAFTAPEFNEDLEIRAPSGQGGLVALGSLDDKLILFKEDHIFYVLGDGPTNNGTQNTFSEPQRLETDVGCTTPRGIVNTPEGILFKSRRGWYLLNRALQTVYVGAKVQRYNSETPRDSLLVSKKNQVRVYHASGVILVFDYLLKEMAVHSIGSGIKSATLIDGSPWILTDEATQRILVEEAGQWLDGSAYNAPKVTTAWIATAQIQGFQRVYEAVFFGELRGAHQLRIRVGYDYDPLWKEEFTVDSATALTEAATLTDSSYYGSATSLGGAPAQILQYKVKPYIQKCQAIRFEITVLNPSNTNAELVRLSGMALTVGLKPKAARTGSAQVIA